MMRMKYTSATIDLPQTSTSVLGSKATRRNGRTERAADLSDVPPLHWWRRLPADGYTNSHLNVIRRAISGISIIGEPRWPDAAMGDPAAAIGVALRTMKRHRTPNPSNDLVMSAVLRCAIMGNNAAVVVLAQVLTRFAENDTSCARLAASWLALAQRGNHNIDHVPANACPLVPHAGADQYRMSEGVEVNPLTSRAIARTGRAK